MKRKNVTTTKTKEHKLTTREIMAILESPLTPQAVKDTIYAAIVVELKRRLDLGIN